MNHWESNSLLTVKMCDISHIGICSSFWQIFAFFESQFTLRESECKSEFFSLINMNIKGINTPSVKRQRQGKRQILGMDLGPILECHHRLTLAT